MPHTPATKTRRGREAELQEGQERQGAGKFQGLAPGEFFDPTGNIASADPRGTRQVVTLDSNLARDKTRENQQIVNDNFDLAGITTKELNKLSPELQANFRRDQTTGRFFETGQPQASTSSFQGGAKRGVQDGQEGIFEADGSFTPTITSTKDARQSASKKRAAEEDRGDGFSANELAEMDLDPSRFERDARTGKFFLKGLNRATQTTISTGDATSDLQSLIEQQQVSLLDQQRQLQRDLSQGNVSAATQNAINDTLEIFSQRIDQQGQINKSRLALLNKRAIRGGSARFAGEISSGILSTAEEAGLNKIKELNRQKSRIITAARIADEERKFTRLNELTNKFLELEKEKTKEVEALNELMIKEASDQEKRLVDARKEERAEEKFQFGKSETLGELAASTLASQLFQLTESGEELDEGQISAGIEAAAKQLGIDPIFLQGKLAEKRQQIAESGNIRGVVTIADGRKKLVNPFTGVVIKDLGASEAAIGFLNSGFPAISAQDQLSALAFAVDKFGQRQGPKMLPIVLQAMSEGKTLDDIDDEIRLTEVSPEFAGAFKDSFGFVSKSGFSTADKTSNKEELDRLLEDGEPGQARDFIIGLAKDKAKGRDKDQVSGREDTIASLGFIQGLLSEFEAKGGKTNLMRGSLNKFSNRVLKDTGDEDLAGIANSIETAIITYRSFVSGAAFTESEAKAYERIFPDIRNTEELNKVKIESLINIFEQNQDNFYRRMIGTTNFNKLFDDQVETKQNVETAKTTFSMRDPETGNVRSVNLTQEELQEAQGQGFEITQ